MVQVTSENLMQHIQAGSYLKLDNGVLKTQSKIAHFFSNLFSRQTTIDRREEAIDGKLRELISSSCTIPNIANSTPNDRPIQNFIARYANAGNSLVNNHLKYSFIERQIDDNYIKNKIEEYTQKQRQEHKGLFVGINVPRADNIKNDVKDFIKNKIENINYNDLSNNENFIKQCINTVVDIHINSPNAIVMNVALKLIKNMPLTESNAGLQTLETAKNIAAFKPLKKDSQDTVNNFLTDNMNNIIANSNKYNTEFDNSNCIKNKISINDSDIELNKQDSVENQKKMVLNELNNKVKDNTLKTMLSNIVSPNSVDSMYSLFKSGVANNAVHVQEIPNLGQQIQITKGNSFDDIQWHLNTNDQNPTLTCKCKFYLNNESGRIGVAKCTMSMQLDTQNQKVGNMNFSYSVEP